MIVADVVKRRMGTRYDVLFEDGMSLTVSKTMARKVHAGMDVDADELRASAREKDAANARQACLFALERADKSRSELIRFLTVRGYDEDIARDTVDALAGYGYVNDAALAARMAETSKMGRRALKQRMKMRGIGEDDMVEALESVTDDEQAALAGVLADKLRVQGKDDIKIRAALARKGFSYDVISAVIRGDDFE